MATVRWYPHAVSVNSVYYSGSIGYTMNGNTQRAVIGHDGETDPRFAAVLDQKPDISLRTNDIAGLIAAVDFDGVALTDLTVWFKKGEDCGTRATGNVHLKMAATSGCMIMRPLRATHNQVVEGEVQAFLTSSNGLADPITVSSSQALAGTISAVSHYTMGPVYITPSGGSRTQITAQDWEFDPGIDIESISDDGLPYPTYVAIQRREPKFTVTTPDINSITTANMNGVVGSAEFFLRKLAEGGTGGRVADATAEHIKFTFADGLIVMDNAAADHSGTATGSIMMDGTYNGSAAIVVPQFDVAIA